ncbi:hypothetical protein BDF20DRAFT_871692 [Mycotypha africana]|uniref:uncharacterized protein n=1 Tax=Mycotypha africana TaxID=64632 RepID=UPI0022FFD2E6|nr:uncharacterized protein BDF20DRAFT_871692 [Mycotypha africana]KAI8979787.1 hypothetical protein BDF20DRAFT_871692 [Mycotypha africana]
MSFQLTELVQRPGAGRNGRPVNVRANFFEVTSFPTQNIHHYDVTIDPSGTPTKLYREIWKSFEATNGQGTLNGIKAIFDGRKNIFSPKPLPLGEENAKQFDVELNEGRKRNSVFKLRIKKVGEVNMEELRRFLTGQSACTSNCLTGMPEERERKIRGRF